MKRPTVNISPAERIGRIAVGGLAAIVGLVLLLSASGPLAIVLLATSVVR